MPIAACQSMPYFLFKNRRLGLHLPALSTPHHCAGFLCLRSMIDSRAEVRPKPRSEKDPPHAAGKGSNGRTQLSVTQNLTLIARTGYR
jgi:hypothetical protein